MIKDELLKPEKQIFSDPGSTKPQFQLNLGVKNTDLG